MPGAHIDCLVCGSLLKKKKVSHGRKNKFALAFFINTVSSYWQFLHLLKVVNFSGECLFYWFPACLAGWSVLSLFTLNLLITADELLSVLSLQVLLKGLSSCSIFFSRKHWGAFLYFSFWMTLTYIDHLE